MASSEATFSDLMWTVHLEGGPQRVNHAAVAIGHKIYSFGGFCSSEGYDVVGPIDISVLNTGTLRWSILSYDESKKEVPFKRYGHTVVAHQNKIYLFAGRNNISVSNSLHCFDIETGIWSLPRTYGHNPYSIDGHSACVIGNFMYVFGGYSDELDRYESTVYRINLLFFEWEKVEVFGVPPTCRDFHTASVIGHRMYIFGGRGLSSNLSEFYCNKVMYLDTELMKWVTVETTGRIPCGRRSHSAVVYNNKIYIFGGYNDSMHVHFNDIYKFNPFSNEWSLVNFKGKGPCPRRRQCTCLVDDQMFLFGGSSPRSDIEESMDVGSQLIDHSDLHVLDFSPTLKRLCQLKVINYGLNVNLLPRMLIQEILHMTTNNILTSNDFFPRKDFGVFPFSA